MKIPKKILFVTLSNIGDVILTLPCLAVLRGNFPKAEISVMAGPRAVQIFDGARSVSRVIVYDKTKSLREKWKLVRGLRRERFDLVVDLRNTLIPFLIAPSWRTPLARGFLKKIEAKREQHLACMKRIGKGLAIDRTRTEPFDFYSAGDLAAVGKRLADCGIKPSEMVLMTPGAQSHLKRWTLEGFAGLADRLAREQGKKVVFAGSSSDSPVVQGILSFSKEPHMNFSGSTSIRELAALMSLSRLVISNDSAPLQMAYELHVPVVAIFGPTDFRKFGRMDGSRKIVRKELSCSPCEVAQCKAKEVQACLTRISADDVYRACLGLLEGAQRLKS